MTMTTTTATTSEETTLNPAIHAAFRRDLARFDNAFDLFEPDDQRRAAQLGAAWENYSYQLHRHHQDEESFFWPAFRELGVDESIVDALDGEHEVMVAALTEADAAVRAFVPGPTADNAKTARLAVAELNRILCDHLAHEERDLDPFSVRHKKTAQHKAAESATRKAHTEGIGAFFAWLCDGCDSDAARVLHSEVPRPVLWVITRVGGRDYNRRIAPVWN